MSDESPPPPAGARPKRRPRYSGKHPRRFEEKYKELNPERYAETVEKVAASGKTPAGTHRPIMVAEILRVLEPNPGDTAVDCTLGYGGHARELLPRVLPGGRLIGLDADPLELPKTEARLRELGFGPDVFQVRRGNFAGLARVLAADGVPGADVILADLGVSSMQLDDPRRGFSFKQDGPLDMRMNPEKGVPASVWLSRVNAGEMERVLVENADEPRAARLAAALAGRSFAGTAALAGAIRAALPDLGRDECDLSTRRLFQALRIVVNDEFSALETWLRFLPDCLRPGGRVAVLTFHSGEDRRVKKAFESGRQTGAYVEVSDGVLRPGPEERRANGRAVPAKLRWARRSPAPAG